MRIFVSHTYKYRFIEARFEVVTTAWTMAGINEETTRSTTSEEAQKIYERDGFAGLKVFVMRKLNIHIGVVGSSGSGKSSLVNSLIGVTDDDEGAAPVGETETTNERRKYASKILSGVNVWDVPGVGTQKHPRTTYLERQGILRFDLVLVVSRSRFTEDDAWLVTQLITHGRRFYFVRTYIDNDIMCSRRRNGIRRDNELQHQLDTMQKIREDCLLHLKTFLPEIQNDRIFLVCSYEPDEYDLPDLKTHLGISPYARKSTQDAIRKTIRQSYAQELIKKKNELEEKAKTAAVISGALYLIPIPGVGFVGDVSYTTKVFYDYRQKFKLDDKYLTEMSQVIGVELNEIMNQLPNRDIYTTFVETALGLSLSRGASFITKLVPVVGSALATGCAYGVSLAYLQNLIEKLYIDAVTFHDYMACKIIDVV